MKYAHYFVLLTLLSAVPARAEVVDVSVLSLEELLEVEMVSSASKMPQKVSETPTAIRVITAKEIRRYGWRTIGEALNFLPGITVVTNRYYDFIGSRGAELPDDYNTRYLMVIDGTPVNDALLESAFVGDAFPLDLALIERIEYVPGAGSAAYGANAMLGTINITTKSAKNRHSTEFEVGFDSINRNTFRGTTMQSFENGAALTVSTSLMHQQGRDQTYQEAAGKKIESSGAFTPDGVAHDLDRTNNKQLYAKLENGGLRLSLMLNERINNPSTAPHGANFDDAKMEVRDRGFDLTANYTTDLAQDVSLYTNLTYMGYRNTISTPYFDYGLFKPYLSEQDADASRWFAEGRLTSRRWQDHQVAIGVDFSKETRNRVMSKDSLGHTEYDDNHPDSRVGFYLQDQWRLMPDWQLHTGLRFDRSVMWGNHFSPRMGITWQATPTLSLKAIVARAFRNPNPLEARAGANPSAVAPFSFKSLNNMDLKAETVDTHELVAEWRPSNKLELSESLYHHHLQKLIGIATPLGNFQHLNLYSVNVVGQETALNYRFSSQWKLNASLTLQHATDEDGKSAPNAPHWMTKLGLDGPLWQDKLWGAWELYTVGSSNQTWEGVAAKNATSVISNIVFTADKWIPNAGVQLRINNLFNRREFVPGSDDTPVANMPQYGRNAALSIRYEF